MINHGGWEVIAFLLYYQLWHSISMMTVFYDQIYNLFINVDRCLNSILNNYLLIQYRVTDI